MAAAAAATTIGVPKPAIELTFALSRSIAFMRDPWKYLTLVCCLFNRPSNSKSGSALHEKRSGY